jgi:hypothetical protein
MTATLAAPEPVIEARRSTGLRIARIHLRMGSLGLARAELEAYAGRSELDDEALIDLAEVRWRTGDLMGAGEVAHAFLGTGRVHPLALVIAAESTAALGRPGEARRLAARAVESVTGDLDPMFAGMPRSLIWPADGDVEIPPVASHAAVPAPDRTDGSARTLWAEPVVARQTDSLPDADEALAAGKAAIERGDEADAAVRLGIALRLAPALAPAILDAVGALDGPAIELVRGDAYRIVGRENEARRSYSAALRAIGDAAAKPARRRGSTARDEQPSPVISDPSSGDDASAHAAPESPSETP